MSIRDAIRAAGEKCLAGEVLSKGEMVRLLELSPGSEEDLLLRQTADRAAHILTRSRGYIWTAVGMDFVPCSMNCSFCSFGEKWHVVKESRHVTEKEILESVRRYAAGGAAYVILRTTEFYSIPKLLEYIPRIRREVPGDYVFVLNTGEMTSEIAERAAAGGVWGAYHALRLREGEDTPFDPAVRIGTMKSIAGSPLNLISLTEPIGPEHTPEEIADRFLNTVSCGAVMGGAMARFPVPGTPKGDTRLITEEEMAHITAVLRLSGGRQIRDICAHPASDAVMRSGANVLVVECGAIPRDAVYAEGDWADTDMALARQRLLTAGYAVSHVGEE
jgi:biotin synthase